MKTSNNGDPSINTNVEKAAEIIMVGYQETNTARAQYVTTWPGQWWNETLTESYTNQPYAGTNGQWLKPFQARADYHYAGNNSEGGPYSYDDIYNWTNWTLADATLLEISGGATNYYGPIPDWDLTRLAVPGQDETYASGGDEPTFMTHYYGDVTYHYDLGGGNTEDLAVSAHTQMKLYTGGKAGVNRLNLFCISAGATEYGKPPLDYDGGYDYPWWDTRPTPVDSTQIKALGQRVGADGNLWVALPDNASPDLNLCVPDKHHYNAWATQQKYMPIIRVNNAVTLDFDEVVDGATNFWVGQDINFTAGFVPALSENPSVSAVLWTFDGNYVNDHTNAVMGGSWPNSSDNYFVTTAKLTNPSTHAWWVSGNDPSQAKSQITAHFTEKLTFANGQSVPFFTKGLLTIYRPQTYVTTATGTVAVDDNYFPYPLALHYGTQYETPGITFSNMTAITNGSIKWLQVVNYLSRGMKNNNGSWTYEPTITNALDNHDPYGSYEDDTNTTADSPGMAPRFSSRFQTLTTFEDFSMWLEFMPTNSGIWVPLRVVNWNWNGNAVCSGTNWVLTTNPNPDPNPSDSDTTTFPLWTKVTTNHER